MLKSLYIIQQQPTQLHLYGTRLGWIAQIVFLLPFTILAALLSHTSSREMQIECTSGRSPTPCQITTRQPTLTPNERKTTIESIQSASIHEENFDGGTSITLILTTPQRSFEFPDVARTAVAQSAQTINTFSQQTQSKPFKLDYSNMSSNRNWIIFWSFLTISQILLLLVTPISVDWKFDTETGWLSADFRYMFWRHHYQKPMNQIQSIHWIEKVHHHDDSHRTSYTIDLITQSGIDISLVPLAWTQDWSRKNSEPVITAISKILKQPIILKR